MLKASLSDYSDLCMLPKVTVTVAGARADEIKKQVTFKKYALFGSCISQINNTQIDNAEYLDIVNSMYNLIENSTNHAKASWVAHRCFKCNITDSESFKFKAVITDRTPADGNTKGVEIAVRLKYLSNFWTTLEVHNNLKLLQQLNSGFKRTIKWKKYLAKDLVQTQSQNLNYMLNTSFQGVNRIFVSSLEKKKQKKACKILPSKDRSKR